LTFTLARKAAIKSTFGGERKCVDKKSANKKQMTDESDSCFGNQFSDWLGQEKPNLQMTPECT
jgi:hypothetical protein